MEKLPRTSPPLRWRLLSWLCASPSELPDEASAELRGLLFSRMPSLLLSAAGALVIEVVAVWRHPTPLFVAWLAMDGGLLLWLRVGVTAAITGHRYRHPDAASPSGPISDAFVLNGPLWCATLGYGTGACLGSGDLGLSVAGALLAMACIGAMCGRIPGSPRLARLQMSLVVVPLAVGGLCAADPLVRCVVALAPIYVLALFSINRQLHADYVEMVVSRQNNRRLALKCPLTALPNRRMFDEALIGISKTAAERGDDVFVLCLDLDGFKPINDRLGHAAGDLLLKKVAERLSRVLPPNGLAARIGGDEFAILLWAAEAVFTEAFARQIVDTVSAPVDLEGRQERVGVSIGISRSSGRADDTECLIKEADQALYLAKAGGKNTFRWYQPALKEASAIRRPTADTLQGLRAALDKTPLFRAPAAEPQLAGSDSDHATAA